MCFRFFDIERTRPTAGIRQAYLIFLSTIYSIMGRARGYDMMLRLCLTSRSHCFSAVTEYQ